MVYSTRRFVLCLTLCHVFLVFFGPFSIAITSLGEERANLSAFCTFVRFVLVWFCRFPLPLGVWEGLRFVIVALPGFFFLTIFYSWARLANLVAGKGRGECFYLFCFFSFIPVPLSFLTLSLISSTISSVSFLPFPGRGHKMTHKG